MAAASKIATSVLLKEHNLAKFICEWILDNMQFFIFLGPPILSHRQHKSVAQCHAKIRAKANRFQL